ncbi:hypothetical protein L6164_032381 [Bauhinia variegata]|uniref:Uncharacterized protein n=1 Tax=Bauhinia variegata TaxID=167791 RepID=A0ACB9KNH9_BAUVA|nr:hypothetical protein L6164_032381 [Bauhinia variegata]
MGCFSSKLLARSMSLHEERNCCSQRKVNGIPVLEDLLISANGNEQYLAVVCAANAVANKLHSRSFSSNTTSKPAIEHVETVEKWEISARLDQQGGKQIDTDQRKRSKSCHWFPEHVMSSFVRENLSSFEDEYGLSSKGAVRSRSFHTVEEYDAILDRIWFSKSHKYQQSGVDLKDDDDNSSAIKEESCNSSYGVEKKGEVPILKPDAVESENACAAQGGSTFGKGNKRKAIAKRLESLRIPSDIECPAIASLREWLPAGGIYSPGSYVTPKFGSYSLITGTNANEASEGSIFSPELVSAFEQCMQNLEAEEENILKQIVQNLEEANGENMQLQETTLPCIQGQTIPDR